MNYSDATLEAIAASKHVKRFHNVPAISVDTVARHSHGVAMLCALIYRGRPSAALLLSALYHDLPEAYTGDMPSPIKRLMSGAMDEMEAAYMENLALGTPKLTDIEKHVLKMADMLDGLMHCTEERRMGNSGLTKVAHTYSLYAEEIIHKLNEHSELYEQARWILDYIQQELEYVRR